MCESIGADGPLQSTRSSVRACGEIMFLICLFPDFQNLYLSTCVHKFSKFMPRPKSPPIGLLPIEHDGLLLLTPLNCLNEFSF